MRASPTALPGVWIIEAQPIQDDRGFFACTMSEDFFRGLGAPARNWVQSAASQNRSKGTLRGLHFQTGPCVEAKLVRCTSGRIFDVAVDLRPGSPTRGHWVGVELSRASLRSLLIPEGCAHGFQALEDESEVVYLISSPHAPQAARGLRWNDPALAIAWPLPNPILSERDRAWPLLSGPDDPMLDGLWATVDLPGGTP